MPPWIVQSLIWPGGATTVQNGPITQQKGPCGGVGEGAGEAVGSGEGVGGTVQPDPVHASQQLANAPTHAPPPRGARQDSASRAMRQRVRPVGDVTQHVTAPGRPHVERLVH